MADSVNDMRAKVLIVEDDAIVALDLQGMVTRLGYDVVQIVENGTASIAAARRFSPDIVLLDMNLAGIPDAIDVATVIHTELDIPVVFCVGTPSISMLARAKHLDYSAYLMKPVNPDSLTNTLDTILYKYKLEKRVKAAELQYSELSQKCEIFKFFSDGGNTLRFERRGPGDIVFFVTEDSPSWNEQELRAAIDDLFARHVDASPERLSALVRIKTPSGTAETLALLCSRVNGESPYRGILVAIQDSKQE